MQTLTETTEINMSLHPDILGVMWPADARAFPLPNLRKGPGIEVGNEQENVEKLDTFYCAHHYKFKKIYNYLV